MTEPKPPLFRLSPFAKNLFLQHCGTILEENTTGNEETPKFFKSLIISKGYLFASQRNKIYQLELKHFQNEKEFIVQLESLQTPNWSLIKTVISSENLIRLNRLLKFPYVKAQFDNKEMKLEIANTFLKLLKEHLTQAKLELCFDEFHGLNPYAPSFIQSFYNRIYSLKINAKFLLDVPSMNLDYCKITYLTNFGQMKAILATHSIKECEFNSYETFDYNIDSNYFYDFLVCPRINEFRFISYMWENYDHKSFENFLKIFSYFPNLKKLNIGVKNHRSQIFGDQIPQYDSSGEALNIALDVLEKIKDFQTKCNSSLNVEISCNLKNRVTENHEAVKVSINRLKEANILQEVTLEDSRFFDHYLLRGKREERNFQCLFSFQISNH